MSSLDHLRGITPDRVETKIMINKKCLACKNPINFAKPMYDTTRRTCQYCGIVNFFYMGKTFRQYTKSEVQNRKK